MNAECAEDFWTWSLEHYDRDGAAGALLQLQDEFGFNVNIALWCCWCAERYDGASELVLRKAVDLTRRWNAEVTSPLRSARRFLKPRAANGAPDIASLRGQIKDAELRAEKVEQSMLQGLAETALVPAPDAGDKIARARRNLAAYTAINGAAKKKGFTVSLLESLIGHIFCGAQGQSQQ